MFSFSVILSLLILPFYICQGTWIGFNGGFWDRTGRDGAGNGSGNGIDRGGGATPFPLHFVSVFPSSYDASLYVFDTLTRIGPRLLFYISPPLGG